MQQEDDSSYLPLVVEAYTAGSLRASFSVAARSLSRSFGLGVASSTFVLGLPRFRGGTTFDADVAAAEWRRKCNRLKHLFQIESLLAINKIKQLKSVSGWSGSRLLVYKQV